MDSKFVIECVRWVMNETLRIFWQGDREAVAKAVRELLQFDVPVVGAFGDIILVQRTDLSPEEEILVHYAGEEGFSRKTLGRVAQCPAPCVTESLQKLVSPNLRQVVQLANGNFRLTDLGSKRVRENLAEKLTL
jgi:hypothetical protein